MKTVFNSSIAHRNDEASATYLQPAVTIIHLHLKQGMMQTLSNGENLNKRQVTDDDFWG